jgi:hypothetical protein
MGSLKDRIAVLKKFITVATLCREQHRAYGMMGASIVEVQ